MDSNNNNEREEVKPSDELTVIYTHNDDTKHPEETETIVSTNQSIPTTKRYKGVWGKNNRWIARIRNPFTNSRVFLGEFGSNKAALSAYFSKKTEFEAQIRAGKVLNSAIIDTHGFLLGDFSRLDDEMRICD